MMTDLDEQNTSRRLWIFAGVCALALHIGGAALATSHLQTEEADDALGATRDRDRARNGFGPSRGDRPAAGPGYRCVDGVTPNSPSRRPRSRKLNCRRTSQPNPKKRTGW